MSKTTEMPFFESEEEEAKWWDNNEDYILRRFEEAAANGTLRCGNPLDQDSNFVISLHLNAGNARLAQTQAIAQGVSYSEYLQMLVHEGVTSQAANMGDVKAAEKQAEAA